MKKAAAVFVLVGLTGACGGPPARVKFSSAELGAPPCDSGSATPSADSTATWNRWNTALGALGSAVGAKDKDVPVVLDALRGKVQALLQSNACMPDLRFEKDGTVTYDLGCTSLSGEAKVRAASIENAVRASYPALFAVAKEYMQCVPATPPPPGDLAALNLSTANSFRRLFAGSLGVGFMSAGEAAALGKSSGEAVVTAAPGEGKAVEECSVSSAGGCAARCDAGNAKACYAAYLAEVRGGPATFGDKTCAAALAQANLSPADLEKYCGAVTGVSDAHKAQFYDKACRLTPLYVNCWTVLDFHKPSYSAELASHVAASLEACSWTAPGCLKYSLFDPKAPHYDAARARRLLVLLDPLCEKREGTCFSYAWAVREPSPHYDAARHRKIADIVIDECDHQGPHAAQACRSAVDELGSAGARPAPARALEIAMRLCDAKPSDCGYAAKCIRDGTCVKAPDKPRAALLFQKACDVRPAEYRATDSDCVEARKLQGGEAKTAAPASHP